MDERIQSEWKSDMKKPYTAPSIELIGSLRELTATTTNGCGAHKDKIKLHTDGFGNGQTGCVIS